LLEEAYVAADELAAHADEIFEAAPLLRRIDVGNLIESAHDHTSMEAAVAPILARLAQALVQSPMARVEALAYGIEVTAAWARDDRPAYPDSTRFPGDADALAVVAANAAKLPRLRMLSTRTPLSPEAIATLADSPLLARLEHVRLHGHAGSVRALFDRLA